MNGFRGMDPDQVRDHALRLRAAGGEVAALHVRLETAVRTATWEGPDADAFRARWRQRGAARLAVLGDRLAVLGEDAESEADEQDAASDSAGGGRSGRSGGSDRDSGSGVDSRYSGGTDGHGDGGTSAAPSTIPPGDASARSRGYLDTDSPWIPDWLEDPAEALLSEAAATASDLIGQGFDSGIDLLESGLDGIGARTDGIDQFQRDAAHVGDMLGNWATGERVPTVAELGAATALATGSAAVGVHEAATGQDTPLLDDRPGGIVHAVESDGSPSQGPRTLLDLVLGNSALRSGGSEADALESGRIGIQEVHGPHGGDPSYIVQIPPTEGADIQEVPEAWGGQGNSRDWGSNLRLIAGQHPAAMDDVRAAMAAADVPPGADVLLVGHSQGGIVANRLSADPTFNSATGAEGTYNVTHAFSVGSPVQTSIPAQASTRSVNVTHDASVGLGGFGGDLIPTTDLGGLQVDGGTLSAPNRHEVTLAPYPGTGWNPVPVLVQNHDSAGPDGGPDGGYARSVGEATGGDPTLSALQDDLTGWYLGEGTHVAESHVVTVGRGTP